MPRVLSPRLALLLLMVLLGSGCAPRTLPMPPEPAAPKYPAFVFPAIQGESDPVTGERQQRGWRFLQAGDLRNAEREFTDVVQKRTDFAPGETGLGYVALARRDLPLALDWFNRALAADGAYAPALVGRAEALLALDRHAEALSSFEAAAAADPSLDLASRLQVLRLRIVQDRVTGARLALERGELAEARASYTAAIQASPESGFLYRELALVERREGRLGEAVEHFRQAVELEPGDVRAHTGLAETLEAAGDLPAALREYQTASTLEPSPALDARINALRSRIAAGALPPEYNAIEGAESVTRGDLAALLGIRLEGWLAAAPSRPRLITDAQDHWASAWIARVVAAGIMDPFANHTFQPEAAMSRRELAAVVARVLALIARARPGSDAAWRAAAPPISDLPRTHLAYPAAAQAVASGVLNLSGGAFHPSRAVEGREAVQAVERLRALAGPPPLAAVP
jgi:tetratricopeptide (TPR) repeat protein